MLVFIAKKTAKISKSLTGEAEAVSYSALMKLLRNKDVKVNGNRTNKDLTLSIGDKVELYYTLPERKDYSVIFSDKNILVIDKKSGVMSEGVYKEILTDFPSARFVHRLDRNTSGLMIFALNEMSETELLTGFKNRTFDKYYIAEVVGKMPKKEDLLTAYLVKDEKTATVKVFSQKKAGAVEIKTGYSVLRENGKTSLVRVKLYTGKTHQIRAHLAFVGHPIVGDGKYGDNGINNELGAKYQRLDSSELVLHFGKESPLYYLDKKTFKKENSF